MIWCCGIMCGCVAVLPPHIFSGMSSMARLVAAMLCLPAAVPGHRCVLLTDCIFLVSRVLTPCVATFFSIGCLGWDDDEGCSKM